MASRFVMANMAAALAQCIFGVGQVVAKLGMSANMSPLVFYLVRVSLSGMIFLAFAAVSNASLRVRRSDIPGFLMVRLHSITDDDLISISEPIRVCMHLNIR